MHLELRMRLGWRWGCGRLMHGTWGVRNASAMCRAWKLSKRVGTRPPSKHVTAGWQHCGATMDPMSFVLASLAQVEMGGFVWKLAIPNVLYKGTIQPYDPEAPYVRYNDIKFQFRVAAPWDTVVRGTGLGGLSVVRVFRATRR